MNTARAAIAFLVPLALAGPVAALTPRPPPAPPSRENIQRYIACYPRIDAARQRYRDEVAALKARHKETLEDAYRKHVSAGPTHPPSMHGRTEYERIAHSLIRQPAVAKVFVPILKNCGYRDDGAAYVETGFAIATHFKSDSPVMKPFRARLEGMLLPNLGE